MKHAIFALPILAILSGCGTIFTPDIKAIPIHSNPVEAEVIVDGVSRGLTPMTLELNNRESHLILFQKEGYRSVTCELHATVNNKILVLD